MKGQIQPEKPYITGSTSHIQSPHGGWIRQFGCLAWLFGLGIFTFLIAWALIRFSLPKPGSLRVGVVQDFKTGQEPRLFWKDSTSFYVLSNGDELIALAAQSLRAGYRCTVLWKPETGHFVDPCWGTRMDITGKYQGGGPPWEMTPLPLKIINDEVWVEVRFPDAEWYSSTVLPTK